MEMDIKEQHKTFSTVKSASPETLFARYLQKQGKAPTPKQLSTWEYDGGQPGEDADDFVFIHGYLCRTFTERVKAHVIYWWRVAKLYLTGGLTHHRK